MSNSILEIIPESINDANKMGSGATPEELAEITEAFIVQVYLQTEYAKDESAGLTVAKMFRYITRDLHNAMIYKIYDCKDAGNEQELAEWEEIVAYYDDCRQIAKKCYAMVTGLIRDFFWTKTFEKGTAEEKLERIASRYSDRGENLHVAAWNALVAMIMSRKLLERHIAS